MLDEAYPPSVGTHTTCMTTLQEKAKETPASPEVQHEMQSTAADRSIDVEQPNIADITFATCVAILPLEIQVHTGAVLIMQCFTCEN